MSRECPLLILMSAKVECGVQCIKQDCAWWISGSCAIAHIAQHAIEQRKDRQRAIEHAERQLEAMERQFERMAEQSKKYKEELK